jgi:GntR family transcriptional regulator
MERIDRSSALPLWAQIADDLRARLASGEFEAHFPTEHELAARYGVSRQTVREAVRRLQVDGLLIRRRGLGTVVSSPVLEQPLHSLYSLASAVRSQGVDEHSDVLVAERRPGTLEATTRLGLAATSTVNYLERLRFAGDEPLAWDRSWLTPKLTAALFDVDLSGGGLYDALASSCGLRITGGSERIRPVLPTPSERAMLRLPRGAAAFSIERLAYAGANPVEWRISLVRGDRYCLLAQWPSGAGTGTDTLPQRLSASA